MDLNINAMYFSPTDTTRKVVSDIAQKLSEKNGKLVKTIDFTLPDIRKNPVSFNKNDLVILGVPVYAGRVPNVLLKYLETITGNGALAVAIVVYGNRDYDDALIELRDILGAHGFMVIAGGAFIGEHAFSNTLAANRPDEKDMKLVSDFTHQIYNKINNNKIFTTVSVKGCSPYRKYYVPKDENGEPVKNFTKITPKTNKDICIDCKLCAEVCPIGSIDYDDVAKMNGFCIKCCACIKKCPTQAKFFDNPDYLWHKNELEINYSRRSEPELFI
jgi:ferredoxin